MVTSNSIFIEIPHLRLSLSIRARSGERTKYCTLSRNFVAEQQRCVQNKMAGEKRAKKLYKKCHGGGGIFTDENFLQCAELGICGKASVELTNDQTRSSCRHDLNLEVCGS